jgi:hypothetical protein
MAQTCSMTRESGGVNFIVNRTSDLRVAIGRSGVTLHNRYVLVYHPPAGCLSGKHRKIKVQLVVSAGLPPLHVFSRAGYYLPER